MMFVVELVAVELEAHRVEVVRCWQLVQEFLLWHLIFVNLGLMTLGTSLFDLVWLHFVQKALLPLRRLRLVGVRQTQFQSF